MNKRIRYLIIAAIALVLAMLFISPFAAPAITTGTPLEDNGECGSCHSGFIPFSTIPDVPVEVPENNDFEYRLRVENNWKHEVKELSAIINIETSPYLEFSEEPSGEVPPGYYITYDGTVSWGTIVGYSFPVDFGAERVYLSLDGDQGILGLNNIDLTLDGAESGQWSSKGSGADEEISLGENDIEDGGFGEYSVTVEHVRGRREISFTLSIEVEYSYRPMNDVQEGEELGGGDSHTFAWTLQSLSQGPNTIEISVSGIAYHEHSDSSVYEWEYIEDISSDIEVGTELIYSSPSDELSGTIILWIMGRVTGFITVILLTLSIAWGGIFKPLKKKLNKVFGPKRRNRMHCWFSYFLPISVTLHVAVLYIGIYGTTGKGLPTGGVSIGLMLILVFMGIFKHNVEKKVSTRTWLRLHFWITILAILSIILHFVLNGSSFSFLGL
ncbi:MAG: ferric reductase-like transmembrane domain-containing protein [Candidatus Thermoplasmatota archaeon]|nr:ferric reductase-like transmembrane domain-containing protein [Candidatus Thermoplasmatota archaeon]MDP7265188.1 ferric reductase-like transmembrane domain-containing protein [Candidatus Thermoplasmatota archaeon]